MQNSRIAQIYCSRDVTTALIRIAKEKGRHEPYSNIVCKDVLSAIKENRDHHLKGEVLEVLESSTPFIEQFEDTEIVAHKNYNLSDMHIAQLKIVSDWCSDRHGRYVELSNFLKIKSLKLRRHLSLVTPPTAIEVDAMYQAVKQLELKETYGVHDSLETRTNERFFVFVLRSFINYSIDASQNHLSQKLLNLDESFNVFFNYGFSFSNYDNFTIYHRKRLAHKLKALGLLSQLSKNTGVPSRYMLQDTKFSHFIFSEAVRMVGEAVENGLNITGYSLQRKRLSKSGRAEKIKQHLKRICYERYHITEECIKMYFPDDMVLFAS